MNFIKKQSIGTWISLAACIMALVAIIVFQANVSSNGYFKDEGSTTVVVFGILSILALAGVIALAQFKFDGIIGKVVEIGVDVLKIVVPMMLIICMFSFLSVRLEGLAYLFGSNEEILATIQTPENMRSANTAIMGIVIYGIASVIAMGAAFFKRAKEV